MRVLILGGDGQLGRDCRSVLAERHEIRALDLPGFDITRERDLTAAMEPWRPDAVVNCAAYTAVDRAEQEREACRLVNADAPERLGRLCAARNLPLVHVSTDYVFAGRKAAPRTYREGDPTRPVNHYGRTKRQGEIALLQSGARCAILRTAWLYGRHGGNFPKAILQRALSRPSEPLKVVADQWGSPTWSWRLATQIRRVIETQPFPRGVLHASSQGFTTWHGFAVAFLREMGIDVEVRPCRTADYPTAARRPRCIILENRRLEAGGLDEMAAWESDLRRFVEQHGEALRADCAAQPG